MNTLDRHNILVEAASDVKYAANYKKYMKRLGLEGCFTITDAIDVFDRSAPKRVFTPIEYPTMLEYKDRKGAYVFTPMTSRLDIMLESPGFMRYHLPVIPELEGASKRNDVKHAIVRQEVMDDVLDTMNVNEKLFIVLSEYRLTFTYRDLVGRWRIKKINLFNEEWVERANTVIGFPLDFVILY